MRTDPALCQAGTEHPLPLLLPHSQHPHTPVAVVPSVSRRFQAAPDGSREAVREEAGKTLGLNLPLLTSATFLQPIRVQLYKWEGITSHLGWGRRPSVYQLLSVVMVCHRLDLRVLPCGFLLCLHLFTIQSWGVSAILPRFLSSPSPLPFPQSLTRSDGAGTSPAWLHAFLWEGREWREWRSLVKKQAQNKQM